MKNLLHTKAVYAASLDPITYGHLWVIGQGIRLFDEFVVSIAINPSKAGKYLFSENERVNLAKECVPSDVSVVQIGPTYLVDFAQSVGATHLVRGARNAEDFSVESTMAEINRRMARERGFDLETVILTPPHELSMVSSSFVKSLMGYNGWQNEVRKYVPPQVARALETRK